MKNLGRMLASGLAAALAMSGCGQTSEAEVELGEASSYLMAAEESGDLGGEVAAVETVSEQEALVEETELPGEPTGTGVCDLGAHRARVLEAYDTDKSGSLEPAERLALKADLEARVGHPYARRFLVRHRVHVFQRLRWVFDENFDGRLSTEERAALVDAMEARCERLKAEVLSRFDADQSGTLSEAERDAAKAAFRARLTALRQTALATYDTNGNKVLDVGERLKLRADLFAAWNAKKQAVVASFDADGNGTLSRAEILKLKEAIQRRIVEGKDAE